MLGNNRNRPQSAAELAQSLAACACAGEWTQVHARHWWEQHGPKEPAPGQPCSDESTLLARPRSLAIEVADRGETG